MITTSKKKSQNKTSAIKWWLSRYGSKRCEHRHTQVYINCYCILVVGSWSHVYQHKYKNGLVFFSFDKHAKKGSLLQIISYAIWLAGLNYSGKQQVVEISPLSTEGI
jgi:hypothetical protein